MQTYGREAQTWAKTGATHDQLPIASQPTVNSSAVVDLTGDSDKGELGEVVETDSNIEIIG
jgi:hypothetical protein